MIYYRFIAGSLFLADSRSSASSSERQLWRNCYGWVLPNPKFENISSNYPKNFLLAAAQIAEVSGRNPTHSRLSRSRQLAKVATDSWYVGWLIVAGLTGGKTQFLRVSAEISQITDAPGLD